MRADGARGEGEVIRSDSGGYGVDKKKGNKNCIPDDANKRTRAQ